MRTTATFRHPRRATSVLPLVALLLLPGCSDVSVTAVDVDSVTISPSSLALLPGESHAMSATPRSPAGEPLADRPVSWSSEAPSVAEVDGDGLVTARSPGTTTIRASSGDVAGTAEVTVQEPPIIEMETVTLELTGTAGSDVPVTGEVRIQNGGEAALTGIAVQVVHPQGEPSGWLVAELDRADAPAVLTVSANTQQLPEGEFHAEVRLTAPTAVNSPTSVEVSLRVGASPSVVELSDASVGFVWEQGQPTPSGRVVAVTNGGGGVLEGLEVEVEYASGQPSGWLSAELADADAPTELRLGVDPEGLSTAVLEAEVRVTAAGAVDGPAILRVRLTVGDPPPEIRLDPQSPWLVITEHDPDPPEAVVSVATAGVGTVGNLDAVVTATSDGGGWLEVQLGAGSAPTTLTLSLSHTDLLPGLYTADVSVTSPDAVNSPESLTLRLEVLPRASPAQSEILVEPDTLVADGESTADVLVIARDERGDPMPFGGSEVVLDATAGTLSAVMDHGDGTYTSTLRAPDVAGDGQVTGSLAGEAIGQPADVHFVPSDPDSFLITGGNDQEGTAGEPLPESLEVRVLDQFENPVSGVSVSWSPAAGDGSADPASSVTDADGRATTTWTLGPEAGEQVLTASAAGLSDLSFQATASSGHPVSFLITGGNDQEGNTGAPLPEPLEVRVLDQFDNPVPGVVVSWSPAAGDGSADPTSSVTGIDGRATTSWTLGPEAGEQTLTASALGFPELSFQALADAGEPASFVIMAGDGQDGTAGAPLPEPLEVRVLDEFDNPVSGVSVSWSPAAGDGSADPTSSVTDADGRATTSWTLGPDAGEQTLTASAAGLPDLAFQATAHAGEPDSFLITGGNEQHGTAGELLTEPLEARVLDAFDNPVSGVSVSWSPAAGDGSADPTSSVTDADGRATTAWTLGLHAGQQALTASAAGLPDLAFEATASAELALILTAGNEGHDGPRPTASLPSRPVRR